MQSRTGYAQRPCWWIRGSRSKSRSKTSVIENSFSSAEFVDFVESVTEDLVKAWGCKYSRVGLVLISGGRPCQGLLVLMQGVWDRSGTLDRAFIMRSHASKD